MSKPETGGRSRVLEDLGFLVGIILAVLYVLGVKVGTGNPPAWAVVSIIATLVAPKMIGRATAGRAWERIFGRGSGAST